SPACGQVPAGTARCLGLFLHTPARRAAAPGGGPTGLAPADLRSAYNLPASGAGGRAVAVVDAFDDPNAEADLAVYRATFGLPACTSINGCFRKVDQRGSFVHFPAPDAGWAQEITLDLEMVSATCPDCHILLVEADSADMPALGAAENLAAVSPGVVAISNSFGSPESSDEIGWDTKYFTHPGIALVAASGDAGGASLLGGGGPIYPAASPLVTAVGGTSLTRSSTPRGWTESAWSSSGYGCSAFEPKPAWQGATGCSGRSIADVSAVGDPQTGVAVYNSYQSKGWVVAGGTSAAAPIIASIYALAANTAGLVGASNAYANVKALNDVAHGSGSGLLGGILGSSGGAAAGYDGPTGLGSPAGTRAF
ncbi:MAG TPA: peptidase S8, partial [Candidatus Dormibacteraeota bacterium]|nr:peptidase S8 [Candidatus Dormibacteraeota bacterium]